MENFRDDCTTIYINLNRPIDYVDLADYAKSYPDKLAKFFSDRICDDDIQGFVKDFYQLACEPDADGPAFEEWRVS